MTIPTYLQAGTKILMFDGSTKAIEDIKVGDYVNSLDKKEKVQEVVQAEYDELLIITTETGRKIGTTPNQRFKGTISMNSPAKYLQIGELILCFENNDLFGEELVNVAEVKNFNRKVYNISLTEDHNISANGFLCSDFVSQQKYKK